MEGVKRKRYHFEKEVIAFTCLSFIQLSKEVNNNNNNNNNNNSFVFVFFVFVLKNFSHNKTKTQINYNRLQGVFDDQGSNKKKTLIFTKLAKNGYDRLTLKEQKALRSKTY